MKDRSYPRTELSRPGRYELRVFGTGPETHEAQVLDVSSGGACIRTRKTLPPGSVVSLWLTLKDIDVDVPLIAEVRWTRPEKRLFRTGLQFLR